VRELTQTSLDPGNCWQTCIACMLDIDPAEMPPQVDYDKREPTEGGGFRYVGPSYMGVLQAYLREHHGLAYVEMHHPAELLAQLSIREPGIHMMTGRTVRSASNGNLRHVVVARHGQVLWDPHPSRAGLTHDIQWAFLIPFPEGWDKHHNADCVCPRCARSAA
jgi:hypothetical protein